MKIKFNHIRVVLFLLFSWIGNNCFAQLPTDLLVVLNPVTPITVTDPDDHSLDSNQLYYYRFIFFVSDTTGISKIHAKIGTTEEGNDLLSEWFSFDQSISLSGNISGYTRNTYQVSIVVGSLIQYPDVFCEVKLEDFNNHFSPQSKYRLTW
jgi:hypothetical protein